METTKKEERQLGKSYSKCFTVGELIDILKKCPKDRRVKYTQGGSVDFGKITYVDKWGTYGESYVIIGELTW